MEELVRSGGDVATEETKESVEDDDYGTKGTAIAGREETQESECYGNMSVAIKLECSRLTNSQSSHSEQLGSIADQNGQEQRVLWWPEHITMDQLPARIVSHSILDVTTLAKIFERKLI